MLHEFNGSDVKENLDTSKQEFQKIRPETDMTVEKADEFWNEMFNKEIPNMENPEEGQYFDDNGLLYRIEDELLPNNEFTKDGFTYNTDDLGRTRSVAGKLEIKNHDGRNEMPDSRKVVAHGEMKEDDHRGHLIADRFNGSGELENLVPMHKELNQGDYAKLENKLAEAVDDGANVQLKAEPVYKDDSFRPSEFRMTYWIDGDKEVVVFKNEGGDKK